LLPILLISWDVINADDLEIAVSGYSAERFDAGTHQTARGASWDNDRHQLLTYQGPPGAEGPWYSPGDHLAFYAATL
jgi:hypothetical protein